MDSFFGVGLPELLVILLLAGVIMGPQQILRVARLLGVWTGRVQREYRGFMRQLNKEITDLEAQELKETLQEVQKMQQQLRSLQRDVRATPAALLRQADATTADNRRPPGNGQQLADATRQNLATIAAASQPAGASAPPAAAIAAADEVEHFIHPPHLLEVEDDPAI